MRYVIKPKSGAAASSATKTTKTTKKSRSVLNPESSSIYERIHEHSNRSTNTAGQQSAKIPYPEATRERIDKAFEELKNQNFTRAEKVFQIILKEDQDILSLFHYQNIIIGLARSLKEQTRKKQTEACSLLEELRSTGSFTDFGASTIHNLDLTLSRCEEALGEYFNAEARLLALRNKKPNANDKALCEPSGNFNADITIARLWQSMDKHTLTETLLLNINSELTRRLRSKPHAPSVQRLSKHIPTVNMALVRIWQVMGKYEQAERLLLKMSDRYENTSEDSLCEPSGQHDIDLKLVRHWGLVGKYKLAERLLFNMSGRQANASEDILCTLSEQSDTDLALVRLWPLMGKHQQSERLLLNMSGKQLSASEDILCTPSENRDIDLTLVNLWQVMGKHELAERLLKRCCELYQLDECELEELKLSPG
ncbi:hypothetical protein [Endozoicomonas sp. 8E]|uniref:hypothetical protein n=1 Tax=Endozoicomonas sp. 8E TaxID=3035692 RepID=UPI002938F0C4|nr:hypothetical protein [Endozoicomonas sp. 8E]WOG26216.1 hypothetical protein P6910_16820 [Endozoicomonas sp. 8E]